MRFLTYIIAYGTGSPGSERGRLLTTHRYLKTSRLWLARIVRFIRQQSPDVVGLIETDLGSSRTDGVNQVEMVAEHLRYQHFAAAKYGPHSLLRRLPYLQYQANALLSTGEIHEPFQHFLPHGVKKLVLTGESGGVNFMLLHLSLYYRTRCKQLRHLTELVPPGLPLVIAGDFNTFRGSTEIQAFCDAADLRSANAAHLPTYPSWGPRKELDFILVSPQIKILNFSIPDTELSDHRPLVLDFELDN